MAPSVLPALLAFTDQEVFQYGNLGAKQLTSCRNGCSVVSQRWSSPVARTVFSVVVPSTHLRASEGPVHHPPQQPWGSLCMNSGPHTAQQRVLVVTERLLVNYLSFNVTLLTPLKKKNSQPLSFTRLK